MLGHHRHGGEQGQWLEVGDKLGRAGQRIDMGIADHVAVGEEQEIEAGPFGRLGDFDIVVDVDVCVLLRPRVPPRRHMVAGRIVIGPQSHLAALSH